MALASALNQARQRGQAVVGPEHLLLGLLDHRGNVAAILLANLGILGQVRQRTAAMLDTSPGLPLA